MRSLLIATSILMFVQCANKKTVSFEAATSQIFFEATLNNANKQLFDFYKSSKYLSYEPPQGWTIYPPLSALGEKGHSETHTFHFNTHPHLSFKFRKGELIINAWKSEKKDLYGKPHLKIIFDTEEQSEIAYQELMKKFTPVSTNKHFTTNTNMKFAEFINNKEQSTVTLLQGKDDILTGAYVISIWFDNDLPIRH